MGSEVFISYSSKDKPVGDAACAILEQRGYRCWIAPRDIVPGSEWGEAIIAGIKACRVFVLIFSANANESPQVRREIERAVHHGLTVVPFRIEDVAPARSMEYFMSVPHWLDALTPPLEQHLAKLADVVGRVLDGNDTTSEADPGLRPRKVNSYVALASLAALVALPVAGALLALDPPWPNGLGYASAVLVAAGAASPHVAPAQARWVPVWGRTVAIAMAVAAIAYLALTSLYVEAIPGSGVRVVKGFVCAPDAELVYGNACPFLGRDALRDAEWEAPTLWTGASVMMIRVALAAAWLALVAGLALAAARIEKARIAPTGWRRSIA